MPMNQASQKRIKIMALWPIFIINFTSKPQEILCHTIIGRQPIDILQRVVRASLDQIFTQGAVRVKRESEVQRCIPLSVLMIDLRASHQEHLNQSFVAVLACHKQQRVAPLVFAVDVEAWSGRRRNSDINTRLCCILVHRFAYPDSGTLPLA